MDFVQHKTAIIKYDKEIKWSIKITLIKLISVNL